MMDESLGVLMQLLDGSEPGTGTTDWLQLRDATLQLRPSQKPTLPVAVASVQSPAGVLLAGQHGVSVISLSVPRDVIRSTSLQEQWAIAEEAAAAHGKTVRREDWRLSVGCHLVETREQAFDDIRVGAGRVVTEYTGGTNGNPSPPVPANKVVDYMVEHHPWLVGTPDECVAGIARLQEASGGFGGLLLRAEDWAPRDKLHRSYELMARYVMPQFQGSLPGIVASNRRAASRKETLQANRRAGLRRATESYRAGR